MSINYQYKGIIMKDLPQQWIEALVKLYPTVIMSNGNIETTDYRLQHSLYYHFDEYWKVSYEPNNRIATINFKCYPYYIPEEFQKIAIQIATKYLNDLLDNILDKLTIMINMARQKDIYPESISIPQWIYSYLKLNTIYGLKVTTNDKYNEISIQEPNRCFILTQKLYDEKYND
jgi:hypothetical protein